MHPRSYEKKQRRTRQLKTVSDALLGLLAVATAAVVYYALTR